MRPSEFRCKCIFRDASLSNTSIGCWYRDTTEDISSVHTLHRTGDIAADCHQVGRHIIASCQVIKDQISLKPSPFLLEPIIIIHTIPVEQPKGSVTYIVSWTFQCLLLTCQHTNHLGDVFLKHKR